MYVPVCEDCSSLNQEPQLLTFLLILLTQKECLTSARSSVTTTGLCWSRTQNHSHQGLANKINLKCCVHHKKKAIIVYTVIICLIQRSSNGKKETGPQYEYKIKSAETYRDIYVCICNDLALQWLPNLWKNGTNYKQSPAQN